MEVEFNKLKIGIMLLTLLTVVYAILVSPTSTSKMAEDFAMTLIKWVIIVALFFVIIRFAAKKFMKKEDTK